MQANPEQIYKAILPALDTFQHLPEWRNDGTPNPYLIGFEGIAPEYIAKAVVRSLQSTMPCNNKAFPTIPEFAADAWNFQGAAYDHAKRNREGLLAIETRPLELSPEEQARRKELVADALKRMPVIDGKGPPKTQDEAIQELNELAARPKVELKPSEVLEALIKKQTQAA